MKTVLLSLLVLFLLVTPAAALADEETPPGWCTWNGTTIQCTDETGAPEEVDAVWAHWYYSTECIDAQVYYRVREEPQFPDGFYPGTCGDVAEEEEVPGCRVFYLATSDEIVPGENSLTIFADFEGACTRYRVVEKNPFHVVVTAQDFAESVSFFVNPSAEGPFELELLP